MTPITDTATLDYLNTQPAKLDTTKPDRKPITDPNLIGHLEYGIDFSQPVEKVREAIGKLPSDNKEAALNHWADAFVANERKQSGIGMAADNVARTVSRGTFVGPFLDEITAGSNAALHSVTGGRMGAPYDETLAYQRARDRAVDKDYPILSTAGQVAGGVAGGVGGMVAKTTAARAAGAVVGGPVATMAPAATVGGRVAQAGGVGAAYGAVGGYGNSEGGDGDILTQMARRMEGAGKGAILGAGLGTVLGTAAEAVNPVLRSFANQGRSGAAGKLAEALPGTVDEFADQVATGATRNAATTNRRTLDILGEEMERSGGDRATAQANTINRLVNEHGVSPATARDQIRRLTQVHEGSDLMLGEYPSVAASDVAQRQRQPGNVNLDELGRTQETPIHGVIDYLGNNGNAQSASNVRNAVNRRQEQLSPSMRETLEDVGPQIPVTQRTSRPATIADSAQMIEDARNAGSQAYRAAHQGPINNWELVNRLPRLLAAAESHAAGRAGEQAAALRRAIAQFYIDTPQGRVPMMTLQQIQDARATIRGQITEAMRAGRDDLVNTLQPFYSRITQIMERASPQWAQANRQWADMNFLRMGSELGDAFATSAGPRFREQLQEFQHLAPQAQDIVRMHFLQKLYDKLDNLGDTNAVSKLFANDHSRNMIRVLFGDEAAIQFTRAVRDQKVAEQSQRMLANSATHRRGQTQKQMDSETGIVTAVENASVRGARSAIMEWLKQFATERRNRPMAEMVTTPMNDAAGVAQVIHNMRQQQQRLQRYNQPSQRTMPIVGAVGQQAGRGMALTPPPPYAR